MEQANHQKQNDQQNDDLEKIFSSEIVYYEGKECILVKYKDKLEKQNCLINVNWKI